MTISDHDATTGDHLERLTLRLPASELEQLRAAAYRSRQPVAALARALLLRVLSDGELPPPAPPARAELSAEAQQLLGICHALTSNLSQLEAHAIELGDPLSRLAGDGNQLQQLRERARETGLAIKRGDVGHERCALALGAIKGPANQINALARALNENRAGVSAAAWHGPLQSIRLAFEKI